MMINKYIYINMILLLSLLFCSEYTQFGGYNNPNAFDGIAIKNSAGMNLPLEINVETESGKVEMNKIFKNNLPKLLLFGYYDCPMLCNSIRDNLFSELAKTNLKLGTDYEILMLSINHKENIDRAIADRDLYFSRYFKDTPLDDRKYINFMVSDKKEVEKITQEIGFEYRYDFETGEYFHPSFIYVVSDKGVITSGFQMRKESNLIESKILQAKNNQPSMDFDQFYALTCLQKDITNENPNKAFALVQFAGIWFVSSLAFCFGYNRLSKREDKIKK